jgi:hypothetical protein
VNAPLSSRAPLGGDHQTESFDSGEPVLDDWLRRRAKANQASGASRTYVVCEATRVVAYYALASGAIAQIAVPGRFRRNMPDPIPVVVAARLAVCQVRRCFATEPGASRMQPTRSVPGALLSTPFPMKRESSISRSVLIRVRLRQ